MNASSTINILVNTISTYGQAMLNILVAIITIAVSLLIFNVGYNKFKNLTGTTSTFSRGLYKISPKFGAWYDHMTYRPFKGAPRGWQIRAGYKFNIKHWQV